MLKSTKFSKINNTLFKTEKWLLKNFWVAKIILKFTEMIIENGNQTVKIKQ